MPNTILTLSGLRHAWPDQPPVLNVETLNLNAGERLFLRGPSGSGKSTLLGLIAGILEVQAGEVTLFGEALHKLGPRERDRLRAERLGVIFQMFNLLPYLSVLDNVLLPVRMSALRQKAIEGDASEEAYRLLDRLGLSGDLLSRKATDLSVGQQQRVAAARALIGAPGLIIADEPTSALDHDARDRFISLLSEEAARSNAALLFVSHDETLAAQFDRALSLADINHANAPVEA